MAVNLGKSTKRIMTAKLIYIKASLASRFQSILFCLIHVLILTSSQIAVKAASAAKKDISNILPASTALSYSLSPFNGLPIAHLFCGELLA